jgi:ABC-type uncharacterized transport system permease subunit
MIRFLFSLLVLAIVVWFATMVPLGNRTLWGHIRAISETREAKDFANGTRKEAKKVADQLLAGADAGVRPEPKHHAK